MKRIDVRPTEEQKAIEIFFASTRAASAPFEGETYFPDDFRRNRSLARRFCEAFGLLAPGVEQ